NASDPDIGAGAHAISNRDRFHLVVPNELADVETVKGGTTITPEGNLDLPFAEALIAKRDPLEHVVVASFDVALDVNGGRLWMVLKPDFCGTGCLRSQCHRHGSNSDRGSGFRHGSLLLYGLAHQCRLLNAADFGALHRQGCADCRS